MLDTEKLKPQSEYTVSEKRASVELGMLITADHALQDEGNRINSIHEIIVHSEGPALFLLLQRLSESDVKRLESEYGIPDLHAHAGGKLLLNLSKTSYLEDEAFNTALTDGRPHDFLNNLSPEFHQLSQDLRNFLYIRGVPQNLENALKNTALFYIGLVDYLAYRVKIQDAAESIQLLQSFISYAARYEHTTMPSGNIYYLVKAIGGRNDTLSSLTVGDVRLEVDGIARLIDAELVRLFYTNPAKALRFASWLERASVRKIIFGDESSELEIIWTERATLSDTLVTSCTLAACKKIIEQATTPELDGFDYTELIKRIAEFLEFVASSYVLISDDDSKLVENIKTCLSIAIQSQANNPDAVQLLRKTLTAPFTSLLDSIIFSRPYQPM